MGEVVDGGVAAGATLGAPTGGAGVLRMEDTRMNYGG